MGLTELIQSLSELENTCDTCNRCGMCQAVCPVFRETGREGDVARGKIALIDGLRNEILTRPARVLERLDRCLLCNSCGRTCSRKLDLSTLFIKARLIIRGYSGLPPHKKLIFRVLLRHPLLFDRVVRAIARIQQNLKGEKRERWWPVITKLFPFLKERHMLPMAPRSFRTMMAGVEHLPEQAMAHPSSVVFFTGCLIDKMLPQVGKACLTILDRTGVEARWLASEACCGIPALAAGDRLGFEKLVEKNISQISVLSFDALVTACATCTMTLKDLWPAVIHGESGHAGRVREAAGRVMDISDYVLAKTDLVPMLSEKKGEKAKGTMKTLTFHEPCHLKKGETGAKIRAVLMQIPGYRYVETKEPGRCCGMGGSFNISHYGLSRAMGEKKARDIVNSGVDIVCTACPACMIQLEDMLHGVGSTVKVRHVMEIFADALGSEGE